MKRQICLRLPEELIDEVDAMVQLFNKKNPETNRSQLMAHLIERGLMAMAKEDKTHEKKRNRPD